MSHTFLRLPAVRARIGLSRSSIYLAVAQGTLPSQIRLSSRAVGFIEAEITEVIDARVAGKSDDDIRALVIDIKARRAGGAR